MSKKKKIFSFACVPLIVLNIVVFTILFAPYPGKAIIIKPIWSETAEQWLEQGTVFTIDQWVDVPYYEENAPEIQIRLHVIVLRELPDEVFGGQFFRRATILETWFRPRLEQPPPPPLHRLRSR